ncbi:MAG: 2-hydroxychromene-2-carboxylate isomerase [Proteobacteria bacterium]|nr:2-hydroxychromene-2-carboxylate isomerase [Pseudomonadota bacterium]
MTKTIRYFFNHASPWTYLGHERFLDLAGRFRVEIIFRPCESAVIFAQSGGLPVGKRAPQRQANRIAELKRWRDFLDMPMLIESRHKGPPMEWANRLAIAAGEAGGDMGALSAALLKARWAEDRDLSGAAGFIEIADGLGFDGASLWAQSRSDEIGALYDAYTEEAMAAQVFGAPTYIFESELFWGQDRLDFLERALAAA